MIPAESSSVAAAIRSSIFCWRAPEILLGAGLRRRVGIDAEDLVAFAEEIDEVAAGAATCVEYTHSGCNPATQQLIEQVDIDGAELLVEGSHWYLMIRRAGLPPERIGHYRALTCSMRGRELALITPPLLLGVLLAGSNWRLVRENKQLSATAQYYASLRHTPVGVKLPDLHGKGLDGEDLTISYQDVNRETLLLVFSPTCAHCKRNWPAWLDLARGAAGKRVVFVNVGGPLPPQFSQLYDFDSETVVAQASPESILQYSLLESPMTILVSADGRSEKVWVGEIASSVVPDIRKSLAWSMPKKQAGD